MNLNTGERIFRIGVLRYKMDSSKTTLQRISGDVLALFYIYVKISLTFETVN